MIPAAVVPHSDLGALVDALPPGRPHGGAVLRPVVIPSLTFGEHMEARIADRAGVCMGMEFLMPQDFIHRAVGPGRGSAWSKRRMVWRILPHVGDFAGHLGLATASLRDGFALAGLLADRIDQYGHFRPDLIQRWAQGKWAKQEPAPQEGWQRRLWERLAVGTREPHPALAMEALRSDADARRRLAARFPELLVVGTGSLDPLLVGVLEILVAAGSRVEVHVVLPSAGYLGDLRRRGQLPMQEIDPDDIDVPGGHPLLESMGRHSIGAFHLLGKLDDQYTAWPEPEPPCHSQSLLGRIQSDVRSLLAPRPSALEPGDRSLQVHSCFGPRREMEVLRDEILRAFSDIPGLKPSEIHIVAPDMETYAPLVSAVLAQGTPPLPVRLSELSPTEGDAITSALTAILSLAHRGRFEAAEVLGLLELPAAQAALEAMGLKDPMVARRAIRDSGLTHGLGDSGPGSASFSLSRLHAGLWFGPDSAARFPDGQFVLPVADQLGDDPASRAGLCEWLARLEATVEEWARPASPACWADRLNTAALALCTGSSTDPQGLVGLTSFLAQQGDDTLVDAGSILDWIKEECAGSSRRTRPSGAISFGRLKQLQSLPCRVLAMVGMQDAAFPGRNRAPSWDLLRTNPRVWDRNPRIDDRQLFLDALLAPSDRLIITAPTQNVRTRESEPFSSCVDELLRVIADMGGGRPVIDQRLQPFAFDYFRAGSQLPQSYDAAHGSVARLLKSQERVTGIPLWQGCASKPDDCMTGFPAKLLANFWKDPAAAFLKACGILLAREEAADADLNRAPLALDQLQQWMLKDGLLRTFLTGGTPGELVRAGLAASRQLPPGALATAVWEHGLRCTAPLGSVLAAQIGEATTMECVLASGARVTADVVLTKDQGALLAWRCGQVKKPAHVLEPWIVALVAGTAGHALPTHLYDESHPDTPSILDPVPSDAAQLTLAHLVEGATHGRNRPLRFALATSDVLAAKSREHDEATALAAAEAEWWRDDLGHGGGDGLRDSSMLAWRDLDPFGETEEWVDLAQHVSTPLRVWGGFQ